MRVTRAWRTTSFSEKCATAAPSTPSRMRKRFVQPFGAAAGQIALRRIAGHHHARIFAQPRQEHLHLRRGQFCASSRMTKARASVRPRMKASGATSIVPCSISFSVLSPSTSNSAS